MTMITARLVLCALCFLLLGCSEQKASEMFETAAFEENQGNVPHAKELYQELVKLYPSTKMAEIARARLADLDSKK
jgi:TolA-binding protein